jgi:hypothetical protein
MLAPPQGSGGSPSLFLSQNVVTGARAINGTVYHNASSKPMLVTVSISGGLNASGPCSFQCDATTTPSTQIAYIVACGTNQTWGSAVSVTFIVLPGNYYSATGSGTASLSSWTEWV